MRRTTISLSDDHERALVRFGQPGPYQDELRGWARDRGIELSDSPAEAALVRVLIDAGIEHIRAYSADVAYRELAEVYVDEGITGEVVALGHEAPGAAAAVEPAAGDAQVGDAQAGAAQAGAARLTAARQARAGSHPGSGRAATSVAGHARGGRPAAG
jgi:hypothetical protein